MTCLVKIYFYRNRENKVLIVVLPYVLKSWSWNFGRGLGLGLAHKVLFLILVLSQKSC